MVVNAAAIASALRTPNPGRLTAIVSIDGEILPAATVLQCETDHGYDCVSASATVTVSALPWWLSQPTNQELIVRLGYDGYTLPRFVGTLESISAGLWPNTWELRGVGRLRRAQYDSHEERTYSDQHDEDIVQDLLEQAGIPADQLAIAGQSEHFGTVEDVVLPAGQSPMSLISRLNELTGCVIFDGPDGVVVRMVLNPGTPSSTAAWAFQRGDYLADASRELALADVRNKIVVTGLPGEGGTATPSGGRYADSPYVPNPPRYIPYTLSDELIESDAYADTVALRQMAKRNRLPDRVKLTIIGNPLMRAGCTVSLLEPWLGIDVTTYYHVMHVHDSMSSTEYITTLDLEGGIGDAGYQLGRPVASFTYQCELEQPGGTDAVAVICDGSSSYDPDGDSSLLTFAWSNDQTADTSTEQTYSFSATPAQLAAGLNVTLVVTDGDTLTGTKTRAITPTTTAAIPTRALYSAAKGQAEATADGVSWQTWVPGGGEQVISTPKRHYDGVGWFGGSAGSLWKTLDFLLSAPTLVHTFAAAVNSIWLHETQSERMCVGLADGTLQLSTDDGVNWSTLYTFADAILAVAESPMLLGQFWVCSGRYLYILTEGDAAPRLLATFAEGSLTRDIANSFMGNFACASVPAASGVSPVRIADTDAEAAFAPIAPAVEDVRGIAHHLLLDTVWAVDAGGRFFERAGGADFAKVGDMASPGNVNQLLPDPALQTLLFIQADNGLYKTIDAGRTFGQLRDYSAAGLDGLQVGTEGLRFRVSTGRRVWITGCQSAGGGYDTLSLCWRCDNIWATTPVWVDLSTGLPASTAAGIVYIDPTDPDVGYIFLGGVVYKNSDMRGTGAWTTLCDAAWAAPHMDAICVDVTYDQLVIAGIRVADDGTLLVVLKARRDDTLRLLIGVVHSHDQGSMWTDAAGPITDTNLYWSYSGWHDLLPEKHATPHAWLSAVNGVQSRALLWRSDDGYVTWNGVLNYEASTSLTLSRDLALASDNAFFLYFATVTKHTTDGYVSDKQTWVTPRYYIVQAPDDPERCCMYTGADGAIYLSTDRGLTPGAAVDTIGDEVNFVHSVAKSRWLAMSGSTDATRSIYRCSSQDLNTWEACMGTVPAGLSPIRRTGWRIAVDPEV